MSRENNGRGTLNSEPTEHLDEWPYMRLQDFVVAEQSNERIG